MLVGGKYTSGQNKGDGTALFEVEVGSAQEKEGAQLQMGYQLPSAGEEIIAPGNLVF